MSYTPHNTIDSLGELTTRILQHYTHWAKHQGINYNTLAVLHTLYRLERCTQKQVCDGWMLPKQTVSLVCRQLQADGHIVFEQDGVDRREKWMRFTNTGKAFAEPILMALSQQEEKVLDQIGQDEAQQLLSQLETLQHLLGQALRHTP